MLTLNQSLHSTSHCSLLVRKAARYGLVDIESLIHLAVARGCKHYRNTVAPRDVHDPGREKLTDDELAILLLHGNCRYEPMAVRCAAQLLKSPWINPRRVAFLAIRERCQTPLRYIASQGRRHDLDDPLRWEKILKVLDKPSAEPPEAVLPHVSRFMMDSGIQRGKRQAPRWLKPDE